MNAVRRPAMLALAAVGFWALHFFSVWTLGSILPRSQIVSALVAGLTVICLAGEAWVVNIARRISDPVAVIRFLSCLSIGSALLASYAITLQLLPALAVSAS